ncbi:caspase-8-like [Leguminivora glycinivorella]|uniref:caspase-8-like n=1 Tax=Leguminivora glycinivorella TaxID=1035111 RepID=UPI00200E125B|nr:caspase-8-like [Leguminivora glycinivorella]
MMCPDASVQVEENALIDKKLNAINLEVISRIEKELEVYDLISLVFLLYDVPDTALDRLIILQRISRDIEGSHMNLLFDWALSAQGRPTWRQQFLEALTVCQLYNVIRKLGFNVSTIKKLYSSNEDSPHINPMKKVLYQLCENMTSNTFENFKKTLVSFDMNVLQYDTCELVLLELMSQKFITLRLLNFERSVPRCECQIEQLAKIIDREPELKRYATILRSTESKLNVKLESPSTSVEKPNLNITDNNTETCDYNEVFNMIEKLSLEDIPIDLKSDRQPSINLNDRYKITNEKRVGICCIINQEVFYPSKESMEHANENALPKRDGSTKDKVMLEKTMRALNFDIITRDNLNRNEMIAFIQEVLKKVSAEDSVFMLCILSHGIRGCVYAADSIPIKVDYIQSLVDEKQSLRGKPKVLILQACQVVDSTSPLVTDSPHNMRKTDFLVCWATAPEFAAYRHPSAGSLFIQILCGMINARGKREHFLDLFTMVNDKVVTICALKGIEQAPIVNHTLRKKLYLQMCG